MSDKSLPVKQVERPWYCGRTSVSVPGCMLACMLIASLKLNSGTCTFIFHSI